MLPDPVSRTPELERSAARLPDEPAAGRKSPQPLPVRHKKYLRYVFGAFWFVLVPVLLAVLAVLLIRPGDPSFVPDGMLDRLRWQVQDQQVPAGIVLFTLFEMALYHFRHSLPLAARFGMGGRTDLPKDLRRDYEQAGHLLEESERILRKNRRAVERTVPSSAREELQESLAALRGAVEQTPFDQALFEGAYSRASDLTARHLGRWQKGELREYAESIAIAVAVALLLRAFVVEAFKIPSGSMLPTLQIQDHIFVNKFAYGPNIPFTRARLWQNMPPQRGDVMVFEYPDPNPENPRQDFIKRVIALPGDTLLVESGHPVINGWKVPNCRVGEYEYREGDDNSVKRGELYVEFLGDESYLTLFESDRSEGRQGPYHVKEGEVWVLGDNRNNSSDSRAWNRGLGGGVPLPNIKGRAMFVWLSFGPSGNLTPDRLLHDVMGRPVLPAGAPAEINRGIEQCLARRPPTSETTPPPPGSGNSADSSRPGLY